MSKEIWKDIEGFEGLYQVSSEGRVKSLPRMVSVSASRRSRSYIRHDKGRVLKQQKMTSGYLFVPLYKNNELRQYGIHQLVAKAFLPNANNYNEVNHKNENKHDNRVCNLEWCYHSYNMRYGKMAIVRQRGNIRNRKPVMQMDLSGKVMRTFKSIKEAWRETGINREAISLICNKKKKNGRNYFTAGGYRWKFAK